MDRLKVNDIVIYDRDVNPNFLDFLYDRKHIITRIEHERVYTKGRGWNYNDIMSEVSNELVTDDLSTDALKPVKDDSWAGSRLVFNFIT